MNLSNIKCLVPGAAVLLLCFGAPAAGDANIRFTPQFDGAWRHHVHDKVCTLFQPVAEYGEARFVATPASSPAFELQARQDLHEAGPLQVTRFAPDWHPAEPLREELGVMTHVEGGGAAARGALAADMLFALRQGLHIELAAPAWFDKRTEVVLNLTAQDLQPALDSFLSCARTNVRVSWQEMARTRISYDVNDHALSDAGRARLQGLANYVLRDDSITKLYVDGHTDSTGSRQQNFRLAKRRAEAVAAYLRECGLSDQQIVVRYHGAAYPVADNATAAGKAENRRTTVRLERVDPASVARN